MTAGEPISFGDNVRVRATAVTEARGLAGLVGQVAGNTLATKARQSQAAAQQRLAINRASLHSLRNELARLGN